MSVQPSERTDITKGHISPEETHVTKSVRHFMQGHRRKFDRLPKRNPWTFASTDLEKGELNVARDAGVVKKVDDIDHTFWDQGVWVLSDAARAVLKESAGENLQYEMPCGHYGFTNPRDSDFYKCKECGGRFTRDEMEE